MPSISVSTQTYQEDYSIAVNCVKVSPSVGPADSVPPSPPILEACDSIVVKVREICTKILAALGMAKLPSGVEGSQWRQPVLEVRGLVTADLFHDFVRFRLAALMESVTASAEASIMQDLKTILRISNQHHAPLPFPFHDGVAEVRPGRTDFQAVSQLRAKEHEERLESLSNLAKQLLEPSSASQQLGVADMSSFSRTLRRPPTTSTASTSTATAAPFSSQLHSTRARGYAQQLEALLVDRSIPRAHEQQFSEASASTPRSTVPQFSNAQSVPNGSGGDEVDAAGEETHTEIPMQFQRIRAAWR